MKFEKKYKNLPTIRRQDNIVRPGDIFVTWAPHILNRAIAVIQQFRSPDGRGKFGHAGFFVNSEGISFEALWKVKEHDFFVKHHGHFVIIARHKYITRRNFFNSYEKIKSKHNGNIYPVYRLLFHIFQASSKLLPKKNGVCSEITGELLHDLEIWNWYKGATPDNVHDWMCNQWDFNIEVPFTGWVNINKYKWRYKNDKWKNK
jgi:hypothetical protein